MKVRVTMDSGAAGHVIIEGMFPRVKLEHKTAPKRLVAASGEPISDMGDKNKSVQDGWGIHRCITFRSASVVKPFISLQ